LAAAAAAEMMVMELDWVVVVEVYVEGLLL
jgi:hypothetical protein